MSPASTIEVEQIEEEGVKELVVAEGEKEEEPPGVVVAPSSSVVVAWCVEWVVVKTLNIPDYQRGRLAWYAALHVAARRLHVVEQTGEFGCPSAWACEHTFDETDRRRLSNPRVWRIWGVATDALRHLWPVPAHLLLRARVRVRRGGEVEFFGERRCVCVPLCVTLDPWALRPLSSMLLSYQKLF